MTEEKDLNQQRLKCEKCDFKDGWGYSGWCYMFDEIIINCKKFMAKRWK